MNNLRKLPQPFGFYRYVLKADHLHFGLWPRENPEFSLEEAQNTMFRHLLSFFPPAPAKVLDVGCGLGLSAAQLASMGYHVVAIAPSRELIEYAVGTYGESGAEFRSLGFFDEDAAVFAEGAYDVVMFQESAQYLSPIERAIEKARKLLGEGGVVVIADEVCYDDAIRSHTAVHAAKDFVVALSENGFRIVEHEKVGGDVAPTCDYIIEQFSTDFEGLVSFFGDRETRDQLTFFLDGWKKQKAWYAQALMGYEIFVAKKDGYFMRSYAEGDEHIILSAFNSIFSTNRSIDHWYWKFRDNPYGAHKIAGIFTGPDTIAAHYAGYPIPYYSCLGKTHSFLSYQVGDTMTSPSVRNIGLGKTGLLARIANYFYAKYCEGTVPFIYGFNTGKIRKLGMRYLGYVYIDPVTFWKKDVSASSFPALPLMKRVFRGYSVEEVREFGEEWDLFFAQVCESYRLLVKRDSTYIRWRYADCPDKTHRVFSVRQKGRLVGWSVFSRKGDKVIWGDALFDRDHPDAAAHMLHTLFSKEFLDCSAIEAWFSAHPSWWPKIVKGLGFETAPEPDDLTPCFVIFDERIRLEELRDNLYYTKGDSDLF